MTQKTSKTVKDYCAKMAAKSLQKSTDIIMYGWPPVCTSIIHQPKRPVEKSNANK